MTANTEDLQQFEATLKEYEGYSRKLNEQIKKGEKMADNAVRKTYTKERRKTYGEIGRHLKKIKEKHQDFDRHTGEVFTLLQQGRLDEAHVLLESVEREERQFAHQ